MNRQLEHGHHPGEIAERLEKGPRASYLRDLVYGGIDGTVTTFAIMAGVVGADLSAGAVIVLGIANLLADGFSMAAANYSSTKTEIGEYEQVRRMEERHVDLAPEGEREEIRQIFQAKGFEGEALETAVNVITEHRKSRRLDHFIRQPPAHRPPRGARTLLPHRKHLRRQPQQRFFRMRHPAPKSRQVNECVCSQAACSFCRRTIR